MMSWLGCRRQAETREPPRGQPARLADASSLSTIEKTSSAVAIEQGVVSLADSDRAGRLVQALRQLSREMHVAAFEANESATLRGDNSRVLAYATA